MNISDIKKMKEAYLEVVSEIQKEDIDPELLKKLLSVKRKQMMKKRKVRKRFLLVKMLT